MNRLFFRTAVGCAWRGLYLYYGRRPAPGDSYAKANSGARQLARITLDPNEGTKPTLTLGVVGRRTCAVPATWWAHWELRIPLPRISWGWAMGGRRGQAAGAAGRRSWRLWLYRLSKRFYYALDGRYGWGRRPLWHIRADSAKYRDGNWETLCGTYAAPARVNHLPRKPQTYLGHGCRRCLRAARRAAANQ